MRMSIGYLEPLVPLQSFSSPELHVSWSSGNGQKFEFFDWPLKNDCADQTWALDKRMCATGCREFYDIR